MNLNSSFFIDPRVGAEGVFAEVITEPELDFLVGRVNGVRTVADVSSDIDAEVTSDAAGGRVEGSGFTEHLSAGSDNVVTFPNHSNDGSGGHISDETSEERLAGKISVMLLKVVFGGSGEPKTDELEALLFESLDDLTDEVSLDTIGLDHDVGSFSLLVHFFGGMDMIYFEMDI